MKPSDYMRLSSTKALLYIHTLTLHNHLVPINLYRNVCTTYVINADEVLAYTITKELSTFTPNHKLLIMLKKRAVKLFLVIKRQQAI